MKNKRFMTFEKLALWRMIFQEKHFLLAGVEQIAGLVDIQQQFTTVPVPKQLEPKRSHDCHSTYYRDTSFYLELFSRRRDS